MLHCTFTCACLRTATPSCQYRTLPAPRHLPLPHLPPCCIARLDAHCARRLGPHAVMPPAARFLPYYSTHHLHERHLGYLPHPRRFAFHAVRPGTLFLPLCAAIPLAPLPLPTFGFAAALSAALPLRISFRATVTLASALSPAVNCYCATA